MQTLERELDRLRGTLNETQSEEMRLQEAARLQEQQRLSELDRANIEIAQLEARATQAEQTVTTAIEAVKVFSGELEKRGHKWTKGWRKRYCVLEGQSLRYYGLPHTSSSVPRGTIALIRSTTISYMNDSSQDPKEFHVSTLLKNCMLCKCAYPSACWCWCVQIVSAADGRKFDFRASTPELAASWVRALNASLSLLQLPLPTALSSGSLLSRMDSK